MTTQECLGVEELSSNEINRLQYEKVQLPQNSNHFQLNKQIANQR